MEMQGTRQLAATQQEAWEALNDPEVLRACIPGCDKVERDGDDRYTLAMSVKIGPVAAKFSGKIQLADVQPPESYTLTFEGQGGPAGFGKGTSKVRLTPNAQGCELAYTVHAQVGGKVAQVGQRLIDGVARSMAEDFFQRFDAEMRKRHPAPAGAVDGAASVGATDPADAAAVAPSGAGIPVWVWAAIAAVVIAAAVWMLR